MNTTETLYRCPADLADEVHKTFAALTARGNVFQASKACVNYVHRLVRREHFSADALREISGLITAEGVDSTTARILGGSATIKWIQIRTSLLLGLPIVRKISQRACIQVSKKLTSC